MYPRDEGTTTTMATGSRDLVERGEGTIVSLIHRESADRNDAFLQTHVCLSTSLRFVNVRPALIYC